MSHFGGETYNADRDHDRLSRQLDRVRSLMRDGEWRTLADISNHTGDPQASVSARLRDFRKPRNGSWTVERRHIRRGLWEYRMIANAEPSNQLRLQLVKRNA